MLHPSKELERIHKSIERSHEGSTQQKMDDMYRRMIEEADAVRRGDHRREIAPWFRRVP